MELPLKKIWWQAAYIQGSYGTGGLILRIYQLLAVTQGSKKLENSYYSKVFQEDQQSTTSGMLSYEQNFEGINSC
jgi:aerobic-type carbon monoxide dehydrogenase small subunit (CoxS/CutS family)